jgi:hypothetical protein
LARRLSVDAADAKLLANDPHLLQSAEDIPGHALGQVDEGVIVTDVYVADMTPFEARFVGDRADDVARLHTMSVTDFEAEGLEVDVIAILSSAPPMPRPTLARPPVAP